MHSTAQSETKEAADGGTISSVGGTSQVKRYNRKMAYSQVSRSRSTRGAHKELNPDKSLAAVWPIITPLLACKCSHSSTHTHTQTQPAFSSRCGQKVSGVCSHNLQSCKYYKHCLRLFFSLRCSLLVYCHDNRWQPKGRQSSPVTTSIH